MCAAAWPDVTTNMAQDIGGTNRDDQLTAKHWRRLAGDAQTNETATLRRVGRYADRVAGEPDLAADEVPAMPAGDHTLLPAFIDATGARCRRARAKLTVDGDNHES